MHPTTERPARVDQTGPLNVEADLSLLDTLETPPDRFFVRTHFDIPEIDVAAYRLVVDGLVARPMSLGLAELAALADDEVSATIECAGNGRATLDPPAPGLQWLGGAVGTGRWNGVRLGRLLEMAGVGEGAGHVLLAGADRGDVAGVAGPIGYERSLPLAKAVAPEVLIATTQSDQPLTPELGGPVRAIVGGWYGMASVKWLTRITVTDGPGIGHWETTDYSFATTDAAGGRTRRPITDMLPKAQVTSPAVGASLALGDAVRISGFAWAGEARVARVDVSDDDGETWWPARLLDDPQPHLWSRWEADWRPDRPGVLAILARCTDDTGREQPMDRDPDRGGYLVNEVAPHPVAVHPSRGADERD